MNDEQLTEEYLNYRRRRLQDIDTGYDEGPDIASAVSARCQDDTEKTTEWIISHCLTEQCIQGMSIPFK